MKKQPISKPETTAAPQLVSVKELRVARAVLFNGDWAEHLKNVRAEFAPNGLWISELFVPYSNIICLIGDNGKSVR